MNENTWDHFGISSPLVRALENKEYDEAEKLIKKNTSHVNLNAEAQGTSALTLVLSGETGCRNFYLAQLLIKGGVSLNPFLLPVLAYQDTPLECVVNFYLNLKARSNQQSNDDQEINKFTASRQEITFIGLQREVNPPLPVLKAQCLEMVDLLLAYGADPGIALKHTRPAIFHTIVAEVEPDMDLIMKLYDAGGNFNREDMHGNSPLMEHVMVADRDRALPLLEQIFSLVPSLYLEHFNCNNETILWRAMLAGSFRVALKLIERGVSTMTQAQAQSKNGLLFNISPIFAPLLQNSSLYNELHKQVDKNPEFSVSFLNKVMLCSVFPVVDSTSICADVAQELGILLNERTKFPMPLLVNQEFDELCVAVLVLGGLKAGLQQLCVRKIIEQVVDRRPDVPAVCRATEHSVSVVEENSFEDGFWGQEAKYVMKLHPYFIRNLVKNCLKLPSCLVSRFYIEVARLQLGASLFTGESPGCLLGCDLVVNELIASDEDPFYEDGGSFSDSSFSWG